MENLCIDVIRLISSHLDMHTFHCFRQTCTKFMYATRHHPCRYLRCAQCPSFGRLGRNFKRMSYWCARCQNYISGRRLIHHVNKCAKRTLCLECHRCHPNAEPHRCNYESHDAVSRRARQLWESGFSEVSKMNWFEAERLCELDFRNAWQAYKNTM